MEIITRAQWGARPPTTPFVKMPKLPTPVVYIHHTGTAQHGAAGMRAIQRYHQDTRGWKCIAYNFVVDRDGKVYEGRGAGIAGGATEGQNSVSHAVCLMGNFDRENTSAAARRSLIDLLRHGAAQGWWKVELLGHKQAPGASTACPGAALYADLGHFELAAKRNPGTAPVPVPVPEEDTDMRIIDCQGKPALIVFGNRTFEPLTGAQRDAWRSAGVPAGLVTIPERDIIVKFLTATP